MNDISPITQTHSITPQGAQKLKQQGDALLTDARRALDEQDWTQAIASYYPAFCIAETMMNMSRCQNCATRLIRQYLRIGMEYLYCLRKSADDKNAAALMALVKHSLAGRTISQPAEYALAIFHKVAYSPMNEVDAWMQMLFAADESRLHTKH
ncbi:hypothetical protein [Teredinibacter sp. KSP-S5-2]|uniref:hypothetical protein n=1 Tax=Teredinibacter sp. KSP-S5-2 TaxID=3034506 RepID=UPI00293494D9|nr:hypothetical protein [Teredinibacter sp. KSP-S5-2]WNO10010.1 hypothetical protein P5V12_02375 [Teredinibacter sp. KSP-S5-2]